MFDDILGMRSVLIALFMLGCALVAHAAPIALTTTVTRTAPDSRIRIVPQSAGKTPEDRLRAAHVRLTTRDELVLVVQLDPANSPDEVNATARRDGKNIKVEVETRRFLGVLPANIVTVPYVEVPLGKLPPGRYEASVVETVLELADLRRPQAITARRPGLSSAVSVEVQSL